jgi:predicted dehydrogenase
VVERGLHVLLETPIAADLREADAIIEEAHRRNVVVEVAEQFHRRPLEQLKLRLIASGIFGRVYAAFNDFAGHGYHGVSVLRSYLGFDKKPASVVGVVRDFPLIDHYSQIEGRLGPRTETQEHGIIEFVTGEIGIFHWTSVGYDSALRWWRSSRFLAEKGMGITTGIGLHGVEQLSLLAPDGGAPQFITVERVLERCDGGALVALKAHTGDPSNPVVIWENRFARGPKGTNPQWHDDEIGVAGCIVSLIDAVQSGRAPTYGAEQARLDQEIVIAIKRSAAEGGTAFHLPI